MGDAPVGQETRKALKDLAVALKREREHLAVQMDLGRKEFKDEWQRLEAKWDQFESKVDDLGDDAKHTVKKLGDELEEAYEHLRDRLKRD
ncbi:MAG: hypothetical protein ACR2PZ_10225 [Pseudomonadales bacterium]